MSASQHVSYADQRIAIVMPALNEEAAIGRHVRAILEHPAIRALPIVRLIVVDNGSDDGTEAVARAAGAEVIPEPQRGYGAACLAGVRAAAGSDIILLMDADGSDDPADAARIARCVLSGQADLAMGSRARGVIEGGALTFQQHVGNAVGALALRTLYGARVSDLGPLRAIRRDALLRLEMREMRYGWSTEMLAKAARAGLRISEEPVAYHLRIAGKSKVGGTLRGSVMASAHILRTLSRYTRWNPSPQTNVLTGSLRQALFIVARTPIAGQTKTRLGACIGHEATAELYSAFLRDLSARFAGAAARDGYDLFWYYTAPDEMDDALAEKTFAAVAPDGSALLRQLLRQVGEDFGKRLRHGFQALQERGYQRIVVIGSDSPQLPAIWVQEAFAALRFHDMVIGPARDGGYYLLGLRTESMDSDALDLFTDIPMSTSDTCARTIERARRLNLAITCTPRSFDVDKVDDLRLLHESLHAAPSRDADPAPTTLAALERIAATSPEQHVGANAEFKVIGAAYGE
jgi:rSAM/selenodomain-associated transferase 1